MTVWRWSLICSLNDQDSNNNKYINTIYSILIWAKQTNYNCKLKQHIMDSRYEFTLLPVVVTHDYIKGTKYQHVYAMDI